MPSRILDVFISTTALDLAAYRDALHDRLVDTGLFRCISQKNMGPQDAATVAFCREKAQKADLFVGLVGMRRGWEPEGDNAKRSITGIEHDGAKDAGRRRYHWMTPDNFPVPGDSHESRAKYQRQIAFRKRVMGGGERIVSQREFGTAEKLASDIVVHLLKEVVTGDLITELRPEFAHEGGGSAEEQVPAVAAAVEKLAADQDVDLLALAKNPKGLDLADLEAKLQGPRGST